jgi:hypothetical protein
MYLGSQPFQNAKFLEQFFESQIFLNQVYDIVACRPAAK